MIKSLKNEHKNNFILEYILDLANCVVPIFLLMKVCVSWKLEIETLSLFGLEYRLQTSHCCSKIS